MIRVVAGCDGGGTSCTVWVACLDELGCILKLGKAKTGPANIRSNPELAEQNIRTAIHQACSEADLLHDENANYEKIVLALAGAGTDEARAEWQQQLSDLCFSSVEVVPDPAILFSAAQCSEIAVATIVGTGSIAWIHNPSHNSIHRAGGLGPKLGDEGGGYWIGCELLKLKLQQLELPQELTHLEESHWIKHVKEIAGLAPTAFQSDHKEVRKIVEDAANEIAQLLLDICVRRETSMSNPITWICAGGIAINQPNWLERIREICASHSLVLSEPILVQEPVLGALRLAARDKIA